MRFSISILLLAGLEIIVTRTATAIATATATANRNQNREDTAKKIFAVCSHGFCCGCGFICGCQFWENRPQPQPQTADRKPQNREPHFGVWVEHFFSSKSSWIEHQKLNQTTPYTVYSVSWGTFFPVNRVEHQKLNQTTPDGAVWLSFWCSTRPSADTGTN